MEKQKSVKLIECFNTFQGEGPDAGQAMTLLRFKYCNLSCPWCDTKIKMRISIESSYTLQNIQKNLLESRTGLLITGGEPTIKTHFNETLLLINNLEYPVANIESNGYNLLELIKETNPAKNVHYIYSPKIFNNNDLNMAIKLTTKFLNKEYNNKVFIKVVYEDRPEINDFLSFLSTEINKRCNLWFTKVWLMPEGTTLVDIVRNSQKVFDACEKFKFNFSSRQHIIFGFI